MIVYTYDSNNHIRRSHHIYIITPSLDSHYVVSYVSSPSKHRLWRVNFSPKVEPNMTGHQLSLLQGLLSEVFEPFIFRPHRGPTEAMLKWTVVGYVHWRVRIIVRLENQVNTQTHPGRHLQKFNEIYTTSQSIPSESQLPKQASNSACAWRYPKGQ